ncbi:TolC family outer membrane protein [Pseudoxanthomonas suwonensis]|uniref:Membrane protein n=1 Tax=Pseudoxanthomonas suwonensis TaxID=314722 RepID=A0A0E3Z2K6_9GAMM|nr:TolC family outer membrane protein [Pseudoxanthomonas suwonensis]AKC86267.1 membrane protein [Pseudoxanthomonas suwonensis]
MIRRSLALALAAALATGSAQAADLLQTYEMARNGDPQLAIAESSTLYDKEGQVQARAALLPQLGGDATLRRSRTEYDGVSGSFTGTSRSYGVSASQTLFNWSQFSSLRAQRALSQAADHNLDAANDDLMVRTAAAYFDVLVAIESLAAAETNESAGRRQFDYADKRLEVGLAPITDVHEARAQYDEARANTILVRNALADAYQALAELTGQPVANLRALPIDFRPELPAVHADADGWVARAIDNNPTLRATQLQTDAAEASVQTARGGHYPTLSLSGGWGKDAAWGDSVGGGGGVTGDSTGSSVGLTLSVPIFAGGATQSRVRQALAQRDIAQDRYEQQRRALDRNTRNLYQALVAGVSEVEARRLAVVSAQSAFDASQVGLEVGTRTVLDVVQNQRTLFAAQVEYARSRYNFLLNRLLLAQAVGDLDIEQLRQVNAMLSVDAEAQLANPPARQ